MTGRKPDALKLLAGTARRDRAATNVPALPPVTAVPTPPAWLADLTAVREWHRLAGTLAACKLLTEGNVGTLAQLCALHAKLVSTWNEGLTPKAALISAYRGLSHDLGLTGMATAAPASNTESNRFLSLKRSR